MPDLAELALHGLANRRGAAFATGVDGRTIRLYWSCVVSLRRHSLILNLFLSLDID